MAERFVAATGGITSGAGGIGAPWTLSHAAGGASGVLQPGDTVWLRAGTYSGSFTFSAAGTAGSPIIFRSYQNEHVIISHSSTGNIVNIPVGGSGSYLWFWGLEVYHTDTDRSTTSTGSFPPDIPRSSSSGFNIDAGAGVKIINCIIHDCGNGIGAWSGATGTEIYGCLSYYNGWQAPDRGHGHGLYSQNDTGTKSIKECILWGGFQVGLHLYSQGGQLRNYDVAGLCCFNNGKLCSEGQAAEILVESGQHISAMAFDRCYSYFDDNGAGDGASSHFGEYYNVDALGNALHEDLSVTNCYFYGRQRPNQWATVVFTGNTVLSKDRMVEIIVDGQDPNTWTIEGNTYWRHSGSLYLPFTQIVDGTGAQWNFSGWQSATGHDDATSVFHEGSFPGSAAVFVRPNSYETGRAHVIVFNWPQSSTVSVDLSATGLVNGQAYTIVKAENYYGTPIVSGTYNSASPTISLPMTDTTMAAPVGVAAPASTCPEFGAFIVLPGAGGGASAPVADFSGTPLSGTAPLTVAFTDLSSNTPTSWAWTFGDGGTATTPNPSHQYTVAGTYAVALTATNSAGADTETKTAYVVVAAAPVAPVAAFSGTPLTGVAPLTVAFTDLSTNTPTSWAWSFGDGSSATTQNPSHQYAAAGTYTVALTATNSAGSDAETKVAYVVVTAAPVADFSATPLSGVAPLTVQFTDLSTNTPTSWAWNFGDSGTATTQNPSHEYAAAGTYTVTLTATNATGADGETKTGYVVVTAAPVAPVAAFSGTPLSGVAPLTVAFTDLSSNTPTSWAWDFGDTGTASTQNPSHEYAAAGTYTVVLTATNAAGADAETKVAYVVVSAAVVAPVADFSGTPLSGTAPLTVAFTDLSTNTPTSWSWTFGDSSSATTQHPSHQYAAAGTYTVALTATNSAGADAETKLAYVVVAAAPVAAPVADFSGTPLSGTAPLTVVFTDLSTNAPTTWAWDFGDGGTAITQHPSHVYATAGTYTVTLTAANSGGEDDETKAAYVEVAAQPSERSVSVQRSHHSTLVVGGVDTLTFTAQQAGVEVRNRHASAAIYVTFDGEEPTVLGDDTFYVGAGEIYVYTRAVTRVQLISAAEAPYSVQEVA